MKASNLREHTDEELLQVLVDSEKELSELQVKKGVGESAEQPLRARLLRRDIARMKTVAREREAGQVSVNKGQPDDNGSGE